ncbi:MAG: hypothetical protein WAM60_22370 [Candidatus Promineifilaceae bacterium]
MIKNRPILFVVLAFVAGWVIGLFVFGWGIWPVQYTGAGPQDLLKVHQDRYLLALADLYARDGNQARVNEMLGTWPEADVAICQLAQENPASQLQLNALAAVQNGVGCSAGAIGTTPTDEEGGGGGLGNFILVCVLGLFLVVVILAIAYMMRQRSGPTSLQTTVEMPTATPIMEEGGSQQVTPIARFQTTYARGHDTYDDSFSIENAEGDFLGECGVGLSETIGADTPKNVAAFEVWLFDKNDIRTVTKVIMSDHAFFDDAIKAKLAPKGEPVLARPGETIVLETASLIVNAEIAEMEYGTGTLPPQSFFERFTVELSAWAKDGDYAEPDVQGRIDELLEF